MKAFLIVILSFSFALTAFGQDSISHLSCKGKTSVIHSLIQGEWVDIKDNNYKLTITKKIIKFNGWHSNKNTIETDKYTLMYIDTTMGNLQFDVDFGDWIKGYCIIPHDNSLLFQIYSVSKKYLQLNSKEIIYRRKKSN